MPYLLALIVGSTAFTFLLIELAPGDPAAQVLRARGVDFPTAQELEAARAALGLDRPWPLRLLSWLWSAPQGNFGWSYQSGEEVSAILLHALGPSLLLAGSALTVATMIALVAGTLRAARPRGILARVIDLSVVAGFSIPSAVVAVLVLWVFAVETDLLPAGGISAPGQPRSLHSTVVHLILPLTAMVVGPITASLTRVVARASVSAINMSSTEAALLRGVSRFTVAWRHVARSAAVPLAAHLGSLVGPVLLGSFVVETVFSWPGLGTVAVAAAQQQDVPVVAGVVLVSAAAVMISALSADVVAYVLDPRARASGMRNA